VTAARPPYTSGQIGSLDKGNLPRQILDERLRRSAAEAAPRTATCAHCRVAAVVIPTLKNKLNAYAADPGHPRLVELGLKKKSK
jgi:hypothetical protein